MKENPDYPKWKLFLDLGKRNLELEENESAKNALSKSILIRQDKYSSFFYRGLANHRLNNFSEAVNDFTKSLEIKDNFKSYIGRGRAFNKLFDYESALKDYNSAYKFFDANNEIENGSKLFFNRGIAYYNVKKYKNSILDFSKSIKLGFDFFDVFQNRGFGYFRLKKWDNALLDFKEAIKRNPDNENLLICYEQLSLINIKLKDFEEVKNYSNKGFDLSNKIYNQSKNTLTNDEIEKINRNWLLYLGFANIKLNNFEKAEYWLDKVNFLYMDLPDTRASELICRAFTLTHLDKYDKALEYIDMAFRLKPIFGWNFIFSEVGELIDKLPESIKNIIRIKYQHKFNK